MRSSLRLSLAVALLLSIAPVAQAHFTMLLLDKHSVKKGDKVTLTYQFGHPFEHELFDAPAPEVLFVIGPDGKKTDLEKSLEKIKTKGDKPATAYQLSFTPQERGDYTFFLKTPPIWLEADQEFVQDFARVTLHVEAQKNWDVSPATVLQTDAKLSAGATRFFSLVPMTRPYGLQTGMTFQARMIAPMVTGMIATPSNLPSVLVEIERYNPTAPKVLPPDEHRTYAAKTDSSGVVTCSLPQPGWWSVTAQVASGNRARDGKSYPVRNRGTIWLFVDEKLAK